MRINWANIQAGREHNFNQHITDGDDIGGYDFGSIMHYGPTAFSSNGQPTIVTARWAGDRSADRAQRRRHRRRAGDVPAAGARADRGAGCSSRRRWRPTRRALVHAQLAVPLVRGLDGRCRRRRPIDGPEQVEWKVQITRQAEALLKYFLEIRNLQNSPVTVQARYNVLGWGRNLIRLMRNSRQRTNTGHDGGGRHADCD